MKFAEHLSAHITPEWRKQYIQYEYMKDMLYASLEGMPNFNQMASEEAYRTYVEQFDEQFFQFCQKELNKINTFFAEKLAEALRKFSDLKSELQNVLPNSDPDEHMSLVPSDTIFTKLRDKRGVDGGTQVDKQPRKVLKKIGDLKLAFSEFYLNLVLLQNYQSLNFTGFRKILKKHDKLLTTNSGSQWRQDSVDSTRFYTCKDVNRLIDETENIFINVLEGGNRSRAMKRLRVPPLGAQQSLWTTFRVGFFFGSFIIMLIIISISLTMHYETTNTAIMCRLFRAPFIVCFFTFLLGINVYGWRTSGVNHVLIFELDPRDHVSEQHLFEMSFMFFNLWALSLLGFIYAPLFELNPNIFPLLNVIALILFLFNPTKTFNHTSRFWFIRLLIRGFTAPIYKVKFADFWIADQFNSLVTLFTDVVYFFCFYINFYHSNFTQNEETLCLTKSTSYMVIRALFAAYPAWIRFAQCLRRYYDEKRSLFPHVVNAGKYSTTFFVVLFSTLTQMTASVSNDPMSSPCFVLWIISLVVSSIYTYLWDIKMDWGLMDSNATKDYCLLREEIVYSSPYFYYFAYIEDFIGRTMWALTISLNHVGNINPDILMTVASSIEMFRRFIWNFFRLENEHLNNCGEFRAVRDISIAPISTHPANNNEPVNPVNLFKKAKKRKSANKLKQYSKNHSSYQDNGKPGEVSLLMEPKNSKDYDKL